MDTKPLTEGAVQVTVTRSATLKRAKTTSILPEVGVENSAEHYVQRLGASFLKGTTRQLGRDLFSYEVEKELMPQLVGVEPTHPEWNKLVDAYWINYSLLVPLEGKPLNITTDYTNPDLANTADFTNPMWFRTASLAAIGNPHNISDLVCYVYALRHSHVANSRSDISKSNKIQFYLWSKEEEIKASSARRKLLDQATIVRLEMVSDRSKVRAVLAMGNYSYTGAIDEQDNLLAKYCETNPQEFILYATDSKLLMKAFVMQCINKGILIRPENTSLVFYKDIKLGDNLDQTVAFLEDAANVQIKQALQQLNKG
jgi:hypothetical protein